QLLVWRMSWFGDDDQIDEGMDRAKNVQTLIFDLRGNPGGLERAWLRLAGHLVDKELTVGTLRRRRGDEPMVVRPRKPYFQGKVLVLLDSWSSSAAELFGRFVQQTQRGLVLGDRSAGLVVRALAYRWFLGSDIVIPYGLHVTD